MGLLGVTSTMARVRGPISASACAGSGRPLGPQGRACVSTPAMSSHILWLKYHGVGTITASPAAATLATAAQNA